MLQKKLKNIKNYLPIYQYVIKKMKNILKKSCKKFGNNKNSS